MASVRDLRRGKWYDIVTSLRDAKGMPRTRFQDMTAVTDDKKHLRQLALCLEENLYGVPELQE